MPHMSSSRPAAAGRSRRRTAAGVARVLSPRGALVLHRTDGAFTFALRAALAAALPALPLVAAGRAELAVYAMLGSFTTTFGHNLPYARRARVLAVAGAAMTLCVGCGSALAAWAQPSGGGAGAAVVIAATALVAGLAKYACDAARLGGLGAVLLLFSFAVAANDPTSFADVLPQTGLAAVGAAVAWVLAVAGRFVHPDRPQRLAVAAALRDLAELLDASAAPGGGGPARYRATGSILRAYDCLRLMPPTGAEGGGRCDVCPRLADLCWSLLTGSARGTPDDSAGLARHLRRQARLLADRRRRAPVLLPELAHAAGSEQAAGSQGAADNKRAAMSRRNARDEPPDRTQPVRPRGPAAARTAELLWGRSPGHPARSGHASVLLVPALRMVLGTGLAGGLALVLGLGHGYWAAVSAAAVLHSVNVRTAAQRAVQRTLGTVAGLLIAFGVLAARPDAATLVAVIVLLEFLLEYVVVRNYALGVVFVTPLALLLTDLAAPEDAGALVVDRALGSLLGIVIGLACALLVVHDRAAVRVERALTTCAEAADRAERVLAGRTGTAYPAVQARLAAAVVELREADDAAAGELWTAEIDPAELAAAEQRAYALLARLTRHP
ncbi:FUSC family protein [Streptomyces sp. NPDC052013]|uniref:FUSC family protein n=1 Tax=Streptomyces sp. NPDC052013 TaxID=3365679 RepID=UPI0037D63185